MKRRILIILILSILSIVCAIGLTACGDEPLKSFDTAVFSDKTVVYTGEEQRIEVTGVPSEATITYLPKNTYIKVGTYEITANITAKGYETKILTATLTIVEKTYNITFKQDGVADIVKTVIEGENLTDIPTPKPVSGYDVKWDRTDFTNITSDLTVNAVLTEKTFTVTYVLNGGENNDSNPKEFTVNSADLILYNPTKNGVGVAFGGWFTTSTFTDSTRITKIASGTSDNVTVYAKWLEYKIESAEGFTIDYDAEIPTLSIIVPNSKIQMELQNAFVVSEGCTWELYKTFTSDTPIKLKSLTLNAGDNVSYVVVWNPDETHFMRYELHIYRREIRAYSFMTGLDGKTVYTSGEIEEGTNLSAPAENPTITAYDFVEWQIDGEKVNFPYLVPFGDNVVITAIFTPHVYSITYVLNDGKLITDKNTYTVENNVTFDTPTRDYYDFVEWRIDGVKRTSTNGYHTDLTVTAIWTPHVYSITYDLKGGKLTTSKNTYTVESNVTFDTPTKDGYEFTGWQINGVDVTGTNGYHDDLTVTATWGVVGYNITYVLNDNETYPASNTNNKKYNAENNVMFVNPSRTGYDFIEWRINGVKKTSTSGYYSDITVTAIWKPHAYSIIYDLKDGKLTTSKNTYTVECNVTFDTPTKDGYDFIEWRIDGIKKTSTEGYHKDLTATAIWTPHVYFITYVLGDGSLTTNKNTYTVESNVTFDIPTRVYYDFAEWRIDGAKATSTSGYYRDIKVTAIWTPHVYSIIYILNNGSYGKTSENTYTVESNVTFGAPTKDGYDFIEWQIDGVKKTSTEGFHENLTVIAIWELHVYNITYVLSNGGSLITDKNTYTVESNLIFDIPTREYCEFKEWQIKGVKATSTDGYYEDLTVTAIWAPYIFNITYLLNGGELTSAKNIYTIDDNVTFNVPTKIGYDFVEWQIEDVRITSTNGYHEDLTIIAIWAPHIYYITYVLGNGGSLITDKNTYTVESDVTFDTPTREYCEFKEWQINGAKATSTNGYHEDLTITAIWNNYTVFNITYVLDGGELTIIKNNYTIDDNVFFDIPIKKDYTFIEWQCNGVEIISTDGYQEDLTVIAIWEYGTEGLQYTLLDNSYSVSGYSGVEKEVVIPNTYLGLPVTNINEHAFYCLDQIISIKIPENITRIGNEAFKYCYKLVLVRNNSKLSIEKGYYGLDYVLSTNNAESIINKDGYLFLFIGGQNYLIDYIGSETNLLLPTVIYEWLGANKYIIYDYAFYRNNKIKSVTIPDVVTSIGECAFKECNSLKEVYIGDGVTSIGASSFCDCQWLTSVTIGRRVNSIGDLAFYSCRRLIEIINLSNIKITHSYSNGYVGGYALNIIENSETKGEVVAQEDYIFYTFDNKNYLLGYMGDETELILPNSYNGQNYSINSYAFYNCGKIKSIVLSNDIDSIGNMAFYGCNALANIYYKGTIDQWVEIIGLIDLMPYGLSSKALYVNDKIVTEVNITKAKKINGYAFYNCNSLTSVIVGDSVTYIGDYAFYNCNSLHTVSIGKSVTDIGRSVFYNCLALGNIKFNDTTYWYKTKDLTDWKYKINGESISMQSTKTNAINFTFTYYDYYWYKK